MLCPRNIQVIVVASSSGVKLYAGAADLKRFSKVYL